MADKLVISVLGDLSVSRRGEAVRLPPSKKTRALLAFLALADRPQRRERLCEIFWDIPDDPRGALRWSLSKIRQVVNVEGGDHLDADRNTVFLNRDALTCDIEAVRYLATADMDAIPIADLEDAAAAFRGRFLDDLALPRCPEFEAWRTSLGDEMEFLEVRIRRTLIDRSGDDPERALRHGHALQALRPDDPSLAAEIAEIGKAARRTDGRAPAGSAAVSADAKPRKPIKAGGEAAGAPAPDASSMPVEADDGQEVRFCQTADGVRIAYAMSGAGPPIVRAAHWMTHLRHDWSSPVWRHWIDSLSRDNRFIRYDQRCNGLSDPDAPDLSFEAMVADLEAIVDAAALDKFTLLGVSQGCATSIEYAVRYPEKVQALVLYGGYARGWRRRSNAAEAAHREAMIGLTRAGWGQDDPSFRQVFTSMFIPGATREQMDWYNELQRETATPDNALRLQESFADIDVTDRLAQVSVPTLVMHARGDLVVPFQEGQILARGIPGARFVELGTANHILLEDEPAFAAFGDQLRAFIRQPEPARVATTTSEADQSRKQITVLLAEIVSPLQSLESTDPEEAMRILDPLFEMACETVVRHGGTVTATDDYGLTAVWGAPTSTEDHAFRACRAALDLKIMVERQAKGQVRVRAALDTGDAVIRPQRLPGRGGFETVGNVVRRAGQLVRSLQGNLIALTARTKDAAGGYMKTERLQSEEAVAFSHGERAYELLSENRALSRWHLRANQGLTRLIGRDMEWMQLRLAWRRAREGQGQFVGLVADAGVGKSRLAHEFLDSETVQRFTVLECGGLQFDSNISLGVIRTMLGNLFGIDDRAGDAQTRETVVRHLEELGADRALVHPIMFALDLPIADDSWTNRPATDRAAAVREAVVAILQLQCRRQPVVLLVEDLHWIDAESEAVLGRIVDGMGGQRLLVIGTYRPEYQHGWASRELFQQIRLAPLGQEECGDFLKALLGDDPSVGHIRPLLVERSDGTPLFLEELVRALAETGQIVGEPGAYKARDYVSDLQVPPNVKPIIAARIDRLPPADRRIIQIAAVIGKVVQRPILDVLTGVPGNDLDAAIARLSDVELLFELQSYPDREYTFKHALTHDVAYESLISEDRKALHARALRAVEDAYADDLERNVEKLADHALRAEDWDAAARYLLAAVDRALDRSAFAKAVRFLEQAVKAVDALPKTADNVGRSIDIRTRMRPAFEGTNQFEKSVVALEEAEALAAEQGDRERLCNVLLHQSFAFSTHGRLDEAIHAADRLKAIAEADGNARYSAEADLAAAQGHIFRSQAPEALSRLVDHERHFRQDWRYERFGQLGTRSVFYLGYRAMAQAFLGNFDPAVADCVECTEIAKHTKRPIDRYAAAHHESIVSILRGPDIADLQAVAEMADECRERAPSPFFPWLQSSAGHMELCFGRLEMAQDRLSTAAEFAERSDMPHFIHYTNALLAIAKSRAEGPEAIAGLTNALRDTRAYGDPWVEILILEATADVSDPERAMAILAEADDRAEASGIRVEGPRIEELRAAALAETDPAAADDARQKAVRLREAMGLLQPAMAET